MTTSIPIAPKDLQESLRTLRIKDPGRASIREIRRLIDLVEGTGGPQFVRMEMGIPGLPTPQIAIDAEIDALREGVSATYPPAAGIPGLKSEMSRFARLFLDITVDPEGCLPTVGSLNGSFLTFLVLASLHRDRKTVLFLDPGFPVHRQQAAAVGLDVRGIDIADCRGDALGEALESALEHGSVCALLYSNPNNPSWMCLSPSELETIALVARKHDVLAVEDLAYFGMDFRSNYGRPGEAPFQPTIAHYLDRYILLVSSSKAFSYAGQRVGMLYIADALFGSVYPDLSETFPFTRFGDALIMGALYATSAGVGHSAQRGLAALLREANDGTFSFRDYVKSYTTRAGVMKSLFLNNGFHIVYDRDDREPIADGFYFTVAYPGFDGPGLIVELIRYGVSAISLESTGAKRTQGIRACVSLVRDDQLPNLKERLERFNADHRQ